MRWLDAVPKVTQLVSGECRSRNLTAWLSGHVCRHLLHVVAFRL